MERVMRSPIWEMPLVGTLVVLSACGDESFSATTDQPIAISRGQPRAWRAETPADGNGNKLVIPIDVSFPVSCGTQTISFNLKAWVQLRTFNQPGNRNVELDVFHGVLTYTNSTGQTFVWHDVGPDHYYIDKNGDLILTVTGPSTASGNLDRNQIVVGHVRMNLTTQEVEFVAGKQVGNIDELACAALT
jgi:hypothetical protein